MFLTRSIRRKLVLSLALVTAMLGLLAFGAISGLLSYRQVVKDLEFSITKVPRRGDLVAAIGLLFEPLMMQQSPLPTHEEFRLRVWRMRITEARSEISKYRQRLDAARSKVSLDQDFVVQAMLTDLDRDLQSLEDVVAGNEMAPGREEHGPLSTRPEPWVLVVDMANRAARVPGPEEGLPQKLDEASRIYRSRFWMVCIALAVTLCLFASLIRFAYLWIFVPIRLLYQGAARVAQGDFNHRVKLAGRDEMVELATTFNQVVERFQQIKSKLDSEVQERSRQLVRSERLAGVGFLAYGVAHEINNPLSAIAMAAESLESRFHSPGFSLSLPDDLDLSTRYLGMIQQEAFRCQQITARLLNFARGQDAPKTRLDLGKIVGEVLDLVSHLSKFHGHTIQFDRQQTAFVDANGAELKQVVLNMVSNALESMEGQGTLTIRLEERADEVLLSFQDTGCGMTPYVLENLFEPFFTERKSGKGTGLGLSISHRIVTEHGGRVEALSDGPGTGSTFRIHLPRNLPMSQPRAA
ncbi:MAG: HAMP domain-containing sensor histidine kinase [Planctomycetaceae bacterium]